MSKTPTTQQEKIKQVIAQFSDHEMRLRRLEEAVFGSSSRVQVTKRRKQNEKLVPSKDDFDIPMRAFVKKYGSQLQNGEKKFTLLVARLSKGEVGIEVSKYEIEKAWGNMTSSALLSIKFNPKYSTAAKENDWVHSPRKGVYVLRPDWKNIFNTK